MTNKIVEKVAPGGKKLSFSSLNQITTMGAANYDDNDDDNRLTILEEKFLTLVTRVHQLERENKELKSALIERKENRVASLVSQEKYKEMLSKYRAKHSEQQQQLALSQTPTTNLNDI